MRKVKKLKIKYEYVYGNNPTPEQIKESQARLDRVYDWLINKAVDNILEKGSRKM